jgi:hypothetical protein
MSFKNQESGAKRCPTRSPVIFSGRYCRSQSEGFIEIKLKDVELA